MFSQNTIINSLNKYKKPYWINRKNFYALFYFVVLIFSLSKAYHSSNDFHTYYKTSLRLLSGNFEIYTLTDGQAPFWYPPFFAYVFSFFGFFQRNIAQLIWGIINVFFVFGVFCELKKNFNIKEWYSTFYFLLTLSILYPLLSNFRSGNIHIMLLYFLMLVFRFAKENKNLAAALLLSIAVLSKVTPMILIPYYIFKMKWKLLFYFILCLPVLVLLPSFFIGFDLNMNLYSTFLGFLKYYDSAVDITRETIQSIDSASIRFLTSSRGVNFINIPRPQAILFAKIFSAIILVPSAWLFIRNYFKDFLFKSQCEFAIMLSALVLLTPSAFIHTMVLLTLSFALIINYFFTGSKNRILLTMIISGYALLTFSSEFFLGKELKNIIKLHSVPTLGAVLIFYSTNLLYKLLSKKEKRS